MAMFNSYVSLPEGTTNDIKNSHHQWKGSLFWSWWWLRNLRIRTYNRHHQWHKRMRTNSHHHQLSLSPCVKTEAARYQNYDINMGWFVGSQEKTMAAMAIGLRFAHQKREKKTLKVLALLCLSASISMNCPCLALICLTWSDNWCPSRCLSRSFAFKWP